MDKELLFKQISTGVVEMEDELVEQLCKDSLDAGIDPSETITKGLIEGMNQVGVLYEEGEYFLPEVLTASYTLNLGIDVLKPHIKQEESREKVKVVLGVVEGDTHDIGKNLVKIMCESAGFEVFDLGRDVAIERFIEVAEKEQVDFICLSTLMTTTMTGMKKLVDMLKERNIREKYKVLIGGGPISQKYAEEIGADAYTTDANACVNKMKEFKGIK